jgi:nifR3 family TIM-barrel protein
MLKIGNTEIKIPVAAAPLAGITNLAFREICSELGAGLVYSEMISSNGLVYNSGKTFSMLESSQNESPLSVQIFGYDPDIMAKAAEIIENKSEANFIDINMGCSVKKILKSNSGSALMKDPDKTKSILTSVRKAVKLPLTIKIRSGRDTSGEDALLIAKIAQDCGVDAVAVHPRTITQGFRGCADWSLIKKIKNSINIPVIGNGDINTPEDAVKMFQETECDGIMIGRAAVSDPFIFRHIKSMLERGVYEKTSIKEHFSLMKSYLEASVRTLGEETACKMMRSRLSWFVKGLPHNHVFKEKIKMISDKNSGLEIICEYESLLKKI